MKLKIRRKTDRLLGGLRLSQPTYDRIQELAEKAGVSKQTVVRSILEQVIDDVKL